MCQEISGDVVELAVIDVMGLDSQTLNHLWECSEVHKSLGREQLAVFKVLREWQQHHEQEQEQK